MAELERTLSDDWTNMDVLTAHRAARDELTALLARWEVLFERGPRDVTATTPGGVQRACMR